jgi:hypothetical protein
VDLLQGAPIDPDLRQGPVQADRAPVDDALEILDRGGELALRRDGRPALAAGGQRERQDEGEGERRADPTASAGSTGGAREAQGISRSPRASARADATASGAVPP